MFNLPLALLSARYGKVSIATGSHAYCEPRQDTGPYTQVEIGLRTKGPDYLSPYLDSDEPEGKLRVYAYVPVELLGKLLGES